MAAREDGTTVFARSHTMGVRYLRHGSLADWCGGNGDGDGDGNGNGDGNGDDDGDGSGVGVGDGVSDDNSVGDGIDEGMGGEAMMAAMAAMAAATRATATGSMATGSMAAAPRVVAASWVAAVLATAATGRRGGWPPMTRGRGNDSGSQGGSLWDHFLSFCVIEMEDMVPPLPEDITAFTAGERLLITSITVI